MFTLKQSIKVRRFSVVSITVALVIATVYSLIFGNPGTERWALIFSYPSLIWVALFSGLVSSRIIRATGSTVIGIAAGFFLCALLETAVYFSTLRMITELYDNMYAEEIDTLVTYALVSFLNFGIPVALVSYILMGVFVLVLKTMSQQLPTNQ
jgi:hypothetical protein